jgi:hypothetical protein
VSQLAVAPELLVQSLFQGACPEVRIVGASFDPLRAVVLLDLGGSGVPDAPEVVAVCHKVPPLKVEFQPRK